jgi:hypothetical protein
VDGDPCEPVLMSLCVLRVVGNGTENVVQGTGVSRARWGRWNGGGAGGYCEGITGVVIFRVEG